MSTNVTASPAANQPHAPTLRAPRRATAAARDERWLQDQLDAAFMRGLEAGHRIAIDGQARGVSAAPLVHRPTLRLIRGGAA